MLVTLFVLICSFVGWLCYTHYYKPYYVIKKALRLSGPQPSLYYGSCKEVATLGYLESRRKWASKYGTTFLYYLGIKPVVVTQDLEVIRSVMVKNFDRFINRVYTPPLLSKDEKNVRGLLFARGEEWRRMRRVLTPMFSSKKLRMMVPLIQESCERLNEKISTASNSGESVDMWKWFGLFTMEVILATAFSRDAGTQNCSDNPLTKAAASVFKTTSFGNEALEKLLTMLSHFPWMEQVLRKFIIRSQAARSFNYLENTALKLIEDRRRSMSTAVDNLPQDLLQLLLEAHDEDEIGTETRSRGCLSNEEVVRAIITILLAGYETTSNALGYTAYLLALNPAIQDKLTREIHDYYGANPDASLYDAAENIDYVTMVLSESLRLFPPAPRTNRECNQTCVVSDNLVILKGVDVNIPIFLLHRNPNYWLNPEKFDPERFRPGEPSYPPFAYLPFGEGPRNCIGKRLALLEAKMALVSIIKDFHFKRTTDTEIPLDLRVGVTMSPKSGIYLNIVSI
ncbi:cytochrome P450 3A24-like [Dysidea avara]|uniref:cytochrome P450 3A24-like n=1 Tax=Dysidea avara TaxID=196820 RepID=UPI00332384B0